MLTRQHDAPVDGAEIVVVLRAGFLDGRHGFMLAVSNAEGTYYRYVKLMRLGEKR